MKTNAEQKIELEQGNVSGDSWLNLVRQQVGSLNFGVVQIVVHGARVVQIERTERVRLEQPVTVTSHGA
jgi:hypothetical protein